MDESGASDNRMTINPSDFGGIAQEWEDGKEYDVVVSLRQSAPGEFEVLDMRNSGPAGESGESEEAPMMEGEEGPEMPTGSEEEPMASAMSAKSSYSTNPAVQKLMRNRKG